MDHLIVGIAASAEPIVGNFEAIMGDSGLTFAELSKAVGELWGELSDEDKAEWWKEQAVRVKNAPKCDWIFRKGKNKDAVCGGCVATILVRIDDDVVRCKKHINAGGCTVR